MWIPSYWLTPKRLRGQLLLETRMAAAHGEAARASPTSMDLGAIHDIENSSSKNPGIGGNMANNYGNTQGTQGNR